MENAQFVGSNCSRGVEGEHIVVALGLKNPLILGLIIR
jgi:hypothetical protein